MLGSLFLIFPNSGDMRIQILSAWEVSIAMATLIALTVYFTHMLAELGFLLEVNRFRVGIEIGLTNFTMKFAFMRSLDMLSLLITIRKGLKTAFRFEIGTF